MENLIIQSKGLGELASKDESKGWIDSSIENLKVYSELTKNLASPNISPEAFEMDALLESLGKGEVVYFPLIKFRAVIGDETCVLCGATFEEGMGSLSRRDNETIICSNCGTAEALEDFVEVKK